MKPAQRKGRHTSISAQTVPILIYPAWLQLIKHLPQQFPLQIYLLQYAALTGCCRLFPNLQPSPSPSSSWLCGDVARDDTVFPLTPRCCLRRDGSPGSPSTASQQPCPLRNDFGATVLPALTHTGYFTTCISCWLTQKLLFKNGQSSHVQSKSLVTLRKENRKEREIFWIVCNDFIWHNISIELGAITILLPFFSCRFLWNKGRTPLLSPSTDLYLPAVNNLWLEVKLQSEVFIQL